jgi:ring-1,2-phenylacetyl-CoA epoxidase subunit PaaB
MIEILDPRLTRLDLQTGEVPAKTKLDQLPTYEAFVQAKEPRPFKHEGGIHATSMEMALIFAKEQYTRRGTCSGIWVIATKDIIVSDLTDNGLDIYDRFEEAQVCDGDEYTIFHMTKRGTQHSFAGVVSANSPENALACAKGSIERKKPVLNIWLTKTAKIRKTTEEDKAIWLTTPEKLFREVIDYKTSDKLREFKEAQER